MKFTISDKIVRTTELPFEKVNSIFLFEMTKSFKLLTDKLMTGKVENGIVKSVINPPIGWADPFGSRVNGILEPFNGLTNIQLTISPAWMIIGFYMIWYFLMLIMTYQLVMQTSGVSLGKVGIVIAYFLFPLVVGKLKVNWDKRRLENWLDSELKNSAQDTR